MACNRLSLSDVVKEDSEKFVNKSFSLLSTCKPCKAMEDFSTMLLNQHLKIVPFYMGGGRMKRITSILTSILILASMLALAFNIQPAKGEEPTLITILHTLGFVNIAESTAETFPAGTYKVTLYAEFAAYHASNELSWYIVGTSIYNLIFSGSEGNFGYVSPPLEKSFTADNEFGLSFLSPEARYFTEAARNPDGIKHALIFVNLDNPAMLLIGFENTLGGGDRDYQDMVISLELVTPLVIEAIIDIEPNTLNLKSRGKWITAYIELPEGYNVSDINRTTILLNNTIPVDPKWIEIPIESVIGDYDADGILDLMVKFDKETVIDFILDRVELEYRRGYWYADVTLTVTGKVADIPFKGSDTIKAILPPRLCLD